LGFVQRKTKAVLTYQQNNLFSVGLSDILPSLLFYVRGIELSYRAELVNNNPQIYFISYEKKI